MLKVTNTSNKVIGFRGGDGKSIAVLPETTVEVSDGLETEVSILGEIGLAKIEKAEEAAAETPEAEEAAAETPEAEEVAAEKKTRKRTAKTVDAAI